MFLSSLSNCSKEFCTCAMPNRERSQDASHSGSWWQGQWEPCHARSNWEPSQRPSRNDEEGEWKFVQKRKGDPSRTSLTSAQAKDAHRTFLPVVLNGPVDQKPMKNATDEVIKEIQVAEEAALQTQKSQSSAARQSFGRRSSLRETDGRPPG